MMQIQQDIMMLVKINFFMLLEHDSSWNRNYDKIERSS